MCAVLGNNDQQQLLSWDRRPSNALTVDDRCWFDFQKCSIPAQHFNNLSTNHNYEPIKNIDQLEWTLPKNLDRPPLSNYLKSDLKSYLKIQAWADRYTTYMYEHVLRWTTVIEIDELGATRKTWRYS